MGIYLVPVEMKPDLSLGFSDEEVSLGGLDVEEAYTVELEAELNQLKEENTRLRKEMEVAVDKFRQKFDEIAKARKAEAEAEADRKRKKLRRVTSWHG